MTRPGATARLRPAGRLRLAARLGLGAALLCVVGWRVGAGPFIAGLRSLNPGALGAAVGIGAVTTTCCAIRWRAVARGLGAADLALPAALLAYYRSQFVNTVVPGGVVGDVHRGVAHGRGGGHVGRGVRAVAWERAAGQAVQLLVAAVVLLALPSTLQWWVPATLGAVVVTALLVAWIRATLPRRVWPLIVTSSAVAVGGHAATFILAARTAGVVAPTRTLLPLALLALVVMAVPLNIGGWGPREGVTAWSFGAAGLGVGQGVATATVYGVLAFAAVLPGAAVLLTGWLRSPARARRPIEGRAPWRTARTSS